MQNNFLNVNNKYEFKSNFQIQLPEARSVFRIAIFVL